MSNSGAGRYTHVADLCDDSSEALPDPREAADAALRAVPWLYATDRQAILDALYAHGLTICWQA